MSKSAMNELEVLIRARYPLIGVESYEEGRVTSVLKKIADSRNKRIELWSASRGFYAPGASLESKQGSDQSTTDPLNALDHVVKIMEPSLFVLFDFHHYLNNPTVLRKLREVGAYLKTSYKSLILVSPCLNVPSDLDKEITIVEFDLPSARELGMLLDETVKEINEKSELNLKVGAEVRERLVSAALGLTWDETENVFSRILVEGGRLTMEDVPKVLEEKEKLIKRSGSLEYFSPQEAFASVGGLESLKGWLDRRRLGFSEKAQSRGLPYPKGVLLIGVQGCGKSLVAKAVSGRWQMPLLRLDVGRVFSSLVGSSEGNIRQAIALAESVAPAILWVDEVEKAFSGSKSSGSSDSGTTARVFGNFITWLQEKTSPVFVMATANDISELPAEFLRKGRFDEIFFVDLPQEREREEILKIHIQKRSGAPGSFDYGPIIRRTQGFSGAELEEAVISAMFAAFEKDEELSKKLLLEAVSETVPLSQTMAEEIESLRRWAGGRTRLATPIVEEGPQVNAVRNLEL